MIRTYVERATSHLRAAHVLLNEPEDVCIGEAAYLVQQTVEKCLLHIYECRGAFVKAGSSFGVLIRNLPQRQTCLSLEDLEGLEDCTERFTIWKVKKLGIRLTIYLSVDT